MIQKVVLILVLVFSIGFSDDLGVDCLILKDENSIICKYTHDRDIKDTPVTIKWIDPNGIISRSRDMIIPAGHGSIYDFRYISGRVLGTWTFKVIDGENILKTNFTLN